MTITKASLRKPGFRKKHPDGLSPKSRHHLATNQREELRQKYSFLCLRCRKLDFDDIFAQDAEEGHVYMKFSLAQAECEKDCALCSLIAHYAEAHFREHFGLKPRNVSCEVQSRIIKPGSRRDLTDALKLIPSTRMDVRYCVPLTPELGSILPDKHDLFQTLDFSLVLDRLPDKKFSAIPRGFAGLVRRQIPPTFNLHTLRYWIELSDSEIPKLSEQTKSALSNLIRHRRFRVIDVESGKIEVPDNAVRYVALSYVWGTPDLDQRRACQLPVVNGESVYQLRNIPRTLADSICLVRAIGQRYIWIDACCIKQDDSDDKAAIISSMGAIYAAADLTIVAATGQDANAGLGRLGGEEKVAEEPLLFKGKRGDVALLEARHIPFKMALSRTKWGTRAWTFQELLLSRRCVIATDEEIYFLSENCYEVEANHYVSRSANGKAHETIIFTSEQWMSAPLIVASNRTDNESEGTSKPAYESLVQQYSEREMTYAGDRLDAFVGLTELFEGGICSNDTMQALSGMAKEFFSTTLAWHFTHSSTRVRIPQDRRRTRYLPSWSWAGWQGPVSFLLSDSSKCCKIEDKANVSCNLAGTQWEVGPSLYKQQTRMLQVTLHLWTRLVSCQFGSPLRDEDGTIQICVSNPDTPQFSEPLDEILENSIIEFCDVLDAKLACSYWLFGLDDPMEYLKRFLIVARNGSFYERHGLLQIRGTFDKIKNPELGAAQELEDLASKPQYIQMR